MYPTPTRSAIPRVIGILAIVFCVFGLFASAIWTWGPIEELSHLDTGGAWHAVEIWLYVWCVLGVAVFGLHLAAGILAVGYFRSAPRMMTIYAVLAIALAVADVLVIFILAPSSGPYHHAMWQSFGVMHIVHTGMALPWPIIALVLINRPSAKAACAGTDPAALERVFS